MMSIITCGATWLLVLSATVAAQSRAFTRDCSNTEVAGTWRLLPQRHVEDEAKAEEDVTEVLEVRANGQLIWYRREPSGDTRREGFQYYLRGRAITLRPAVTPSGRWVRCQLEGDSRLVVFAVPAGEAEGAARRLELHRVGAARP